MLAIYQQNIMLFGLILSFSTIVYATPSPRAISTCKPIASGVLTTSEKWNGNDDDSPTGIWKPFHFNSNLEVSYVASGGVASIQAEFQVCNPNYAGASNIVDPNFPGDMVYYGRVYIPSLQKCLAVTNPDSRVGPYFVKALACGSRTTAAASIPFNFIYKKWYSEEPDTFFIFWVGKSRADGTNPQGLCETGSFGYQHDDYHLPITGTNNRLQLLCEQNGNSGPFAELRAN